MPPPGASLRTRQSILRGEPATLFPTTSLHTHLYTVTVLVQVYPRDGTLTVAGRSMKGVSAFPCRLKPTNPLRAFLRMERKPSSSDSAHQAWVLLASLVPPGKAGGLPATWRRGQPLNAVVSILPTGRGHGACCPITSHCGKPVITTFAFGIRTELGSGSILLIF